MSPPVERAVSASAFRRSCWALIPSRLRPACVDGDGVEARVIPEGVRRAETQFRRAETLWFPMLRLPFSCLDAEGTVEFHRLARAPDDAYT